MRITLMAVVARGGPKAEQEYQFAPPRKWRLDFAYPEDMIGIECEGGAWTGGRHVTGPGFEADCEKYTTAAIMGWKVLRFTGGMIEEGWALECIEAALSGGSAPVRIRGYGIPQSPR